MQAGNLVTQAIHPLIRAHAQQRTDAEALGAPGRTPLRYGSLLTLMETVKDRLNALGLGRGNRIAIVLPNGPEMAAAFLSVASCASSAPLNPSYRETEFEFYLRDLNAKALLVQEGIDSPALGVARSLGIPTLWLRPLTGEPAGLFEIEGEAVSTPDRQGFAEAGDEALVLHTSGTTSRPKIVPLTQANLCVSAQHIRQTLRLAESDRCLNVMPLFHIHGLMAAVLSSVAAGAQVSCTPGFYAPQFFEWMDACRPTWYTAVPTMHQAILDRAGENRDVIAAHPLRFVRSSSASLPPQVMEALENTFNAPVVEAYGMTEASHQMASNPLPPGERKPKSVGMAAGPEVAVMDEAGRMLPPGETGEVVIRGANVTAGYENNPEANRGAFTGDWFHTGDQGYLDADGYLFLTGRLKEIINRGGEKISPREIDETLLDHPAVGQALAFAVPDPRLGESLAAVVVLRSGTTVTERQLRAFVAARLAPFKTPDRIVFMDEIPKGPTGKLQRIGLAERLGVTAAERNPADTPFTPPRTDVEEGLAAVWASVLGVAQVGIHDHFLDLGGDSMLAARLLARVNQAMDLDLSLLDFFDAPTVAEQAALIEAALLNEMAEEAGQGAPPEAL